MSKSQGDVIGTIERIWRYPLKSAPGEALGSAALGDLGIPGDRGWALIDRETGYIGSAKLPRSWRSLLRFSARYLAEPRPGSPVPAIELTLPDGACVRSDDPAANDLISTAIGRPVRLSSIPPRERIVVREWPDIDGMLFRATESAGEIGKAAPGAFFDHAPVHLLTTASLAALTAAAPHADADPLRFRPTLLIQSAENASGVRGKRLGWSPDQHRRRCAEGDRAKPSLRGRDLAARKSVAQPRRAAGTCCREPHPV